VSFVGLILHSVATRKVRTALTAVAVALGVGTVVTLGVVTHSLRSRAIAVLQTGQADFTVAQKGVSDVLYSTLSEDELNRVRATPGVQSATGVLVTTTKLNAQNPLFIEIGIRPEDLEPFGVSILEGRAFGPTATNEVMLGYRAAANLGKQVGQTFTADGITYRVVGLFRTGNSIGDSASMFPLTALQASQRQAGNVTLVFVKVQPGANINRVGALIEHDNAQLTAVRTQTQFGEVDRNLQLISAADKGSTILALVIGAIIVTNTMLLSFSERTREFGLLGAVGWARLRIIALVFGEALIVGVIGAAVGVGLSFLATAALRHVAELAGILNPVYTAGIFARALYVAAGTAVLGALYPAVRAASLEPLEALRRE
jgi:putative ABC transport system permease protein